MNALAATSAGFRRAPRLIQVCNYLGIDAAPHHIPRVCSFNFVAYANAAGTENTAVVINDETIVRGVHLESGIAIRKRNVRDL